MVAAVSGVLLPFVQNRNVVKTVLSVGTFCFDLYACYEKYNETEIDPKACSDDSFAGYLRCASAHFGKISIPTSFIASKPATKAISQIANGIFSKERITRWFGENTTFAVNPYHPKHFLNIGTFLLGIPETLLCIYECIAFWQEKIESARSKADQKIQWIVAFNTLTNRTALHFYHSLFKKWSKL